MNSDHIVAAVQKASIEHAKKLEQLVLSGQNRIEERLPGGGRIVYEVPAWHRRPLDRLKVERARFKHRRAR